jgi:hypothetical protein
VNSSSESRHRSAGLPSTGTLERRADKATRYADCAAKQGRPEIEQLYRPLAADLTSLARRAEAS